jgi:hypothetical protein
MIQQDPAHYIATAQQDQETSPETNQPQDPQLISGQPKDLERLNSN